MQIPWQIRPPWQAVRRLCALTVTITTAVIIILARLSRCFMAKASPHLGMACIPMAKDWAVGSVAPQSRSSATCAGASKAARTQNNSSEWVGVLEPFLPSQEQGLNPNAAGFPDSALLLLTSKPCSLGPVLPSRVCACILLGGGVCVCVHGCGWACGPTPVCRHCLCQV